MSGVLHPAASKGRRMGGINPTDADISSIAASAGPEIVKRSRELVVANPYAAAAKEEFCAGLVGNGIMLSSTLTDRERRKEVLALWHRWCDEADADGMASFCGLQDIVAGALFDAGEVFVRLRARRPSDGLSVPLQLQLLESEFLDRSYTTTAANGNEIKAGIEFDRIGRRVAYHFWRRHPGDRLTTAFVQDRVAVPASEVIHVYEVTRSGQIRGLPRLTPAIVRMYFLDQYDDAELDRKKTAALLAAFVTAPEPFDDASKFSNEEPDADHPGIAIANWEPGTIQTLEPGEDVKFSEPADVGGNYEIFQYRNLLAISAGIGVPYANMTGDVSRANYSSLRADQLRFRRKVARIQGKTLEFLFCKGVWNRWLDTAFLSGALRGKDLEAIRANTSWIRPKWEWVDPYKDRKAEELAITMGIKSRSAVIIEEGGDPEVVDEQIRADRERERELGLSFGEHPVESLDPALDPDRQEATPIAPQRRQGNE